MPDRQPEEAHGRKAPGVGTLSDILSNTSSSGFIGRTEELQTLFDALLSTSLHTSVVYMRGVSGTGKSAVLQQFLKTVEATRTHAVYLLNLREDVASVENCTASLAACVCGTTTNHLTIDDVVQRVNAAAATGEGAVLAVDAYDRLRQHEPWFRSRILLRLGPKVLVVLTGQTPPSQLWGEDREWRSLVRTLEMRDLDFEQSRKLLEARGIRDPLVQEEAFAASSGRPEYLMRAAEAYDMDAATLAAPGSSLLMDTAYRKRLSSFFIERVLHPDSRRNGWRPGQGSGAVDLGLAAASLLPTIRKGVLADLVGKKDADAAWPVLVALPGTSRAKDGYALAPALRERVRDIVLRERPWLSMFWRRRAVAHYLNAVTRRNPLDDQLGDAWSQISRLSEESPWWTPLNPDAEGREQWAFAFGVAGPQDWADLAACRTAVTSERPDKALEDVRRLAEEHPEQFAVARNPAGQIIGYLVCTPEQDVPKGLKGGRTLHLAHVGALSPGSGVERALLRVALESAPSFQSVSARGAGFWPEGLKASWLCTLPLIGFEIADEAGLPAAQLDLGPRGFIDWLKAAATERDAPMRSEEWVSATEEALQNLNSLPALDISRAAGFLRAVIGDCDVSYVRSWLLDALNSVRMSEAGRTILLSYYAEEVGSHEQVANALDMPRSTYFRVRNQAVNDLASSLFSAF